MTHSIYLYIAIMAGVSFLIRTLPLTLIRRPITNRFLRSFLFYVPYVTLAVMTFPAIVQATQSPLAGAGARAGHCACLQRRKPVHRRGLLLRRRADCGMGFALIARALGDGRPYSRKTNDFRIEPPVSSW